MLLSYFTTEWPDKHCQKCLNMKREKYIRLLKKEQRMEIYKQYLPNRIVPLNSLNMYAEFSNISVEIITKVS